MAHIAPSRVRAVAVVGAQQVSDMIAGLRHTGLDRYLTIDQAIEMQFSLVDVIRQHVGSDDFFTHDYGQVRELASVAFGGGGRPRATAVVESILAHHFNAEDAVLVQGAGTGAIAAMLGGAVASGSRVLLHEAHPYKTTTWTMQNMGLEVTRANFNNRSKFLNSLRPDLDAVYVQSTPQQLGDSYDLAELIDCVRDRIPDALVLVDDNYAVMRQPKIGVQDGADVSSFSFFKLLAGSQVGCVIGSENVTLKVRQGLSSAGCQVQGPDAMDALRSLVYAPVALAVQGKAVQEAASRINAAVAEGALPLVQEAIVAPTGPRCVVVVFNQPVAEEVMHAAWRSGSPSLSVGEESRYEVLPLFTYLPSTFLKARPELTAYAFRINPMRGGPGGVLDVLRRAVDGYRSSQGDVRQEPDASREGRQEVGS